MWSCFPAHGRHSLASPGTRKQPLVRNSFGCDFKTLLLRTPAAVAGRCWLSLIPLPGVPAANCRDMFVASQTCHQHLTNLSPIVQRAGAVGAIRVSLPGRPPADRGNIPLAGKSHAARLRAVREASDRQRFCCQWQWQRRWQHYQWRQKRLHQRQQWQRWKQRPIGGGAPANGRGKRRGSGRTKKTDSFSLGPGPQLRQTGALLLPKGSKALQAELLQRRALPSAMRQRQRILEGPWKRGGNRGGDWLGCCCCRKSGTKVLNHVC